jgi:hypothetical protein
VLKDRNIHTYIHDNDVMQRASVKTNDINVLISLYIHINMN